MSNKNQNKGKGFGKGKRWHPEHLHVQRTEHWPPQGPNKPQQLHWLRQGIGDEGTVESTGSRRTGNDGTYQKEKGSWGDIMVDSDIEQVYQRRASRETKNGRGSGR